MSNLLNLAQMSLNEFLHYKDIVKIYEGNKLQGFLLDLPFRMMKNYFIDIWFDSKTLLIHHPDQPAVLKNGKSNGKSSDVWFWVIQGKLHKLDGPASNVSPNFYAINGVIYYSIESYNQGLYLLNHPELESFI